MKKIILSIIFTLIFAVTSSAFDWNNPDDIRELNKVINEYAKLLEDDRDNKMEMLVNIISTDADLLYYDKENKTLIYVTILPLSAKTFDERIKNVEWKKELSEFAKKLKADLFNAELYDYVYGMGCSIEYWFFSNDKETLFSINGK